MRSLIAVSLLAFAATAQVGTPITFEPNMFRSTYDEYLFCGICQYDKGQWYKLECDTTFTADSLGTLKYDCDGTCGTCAKSTKVKMGERIDASYNSDANDIATTSSNTSFSAIFATEANCCPGLLWTNSHDDSQCSASNKKKYEIAGCSGILPGFWMDCPGHDSTPTYHLACSGTATVSGDLCPSGDCTSAKATNEPCVLFDGTALSTRSQETMGCHMDNNLKCVRTQNGYYYTKPATTPSDYSSLTCNGKEGTDFRPAGAASASIAAALVVVAAAFLF